MKLVHDFEKVNAAPRPF